ncbi:MAG TPA: DUF488 domain-containing protein [Solirubrobacterales bacterium]|nr:DUF488 domain-containing protein [Solirubrobacterales bacterium]
MVPPRPAARARRSAARRRTARSPGPGLPRAAAPLLSRTLATIGVYGFDGASFVEALRGAGITLLLDVRQRRGVRGSEYAWANARRLEAALAEAGIAYGHLPELAPTTEMRQLQYREDERRGEGKRSRTELAPEYVSRYTEEVLDRVDLEPIVKWIGAQHPALLCVERDPEACHRSLIAARMQSEFGCEVEHLKPA